MEFVGQSGSSGAYSLLGVPGLSTLDLDVDDDEGEFVFGIRPKSSPLPRRRSSVSDEDSEPELPPCGSRRVSFADAKGLSLVQVKTFDTWDVPNLPGHDCSESSGTEEDDYFLSPLNFCLPSSAEELFHKVQEQKLELETIELVPGTTILRGVIRVLNICFSKAVYIRTTLDKWSSHFDLLAEHIPGSGNNLTDRFSFKLTLVPPFGEQGARVDFCLRYESPAGTFWANNNSKNYVLLCQKRVKKRLDKPQWENAYKKSCLKTAGQNFSAVEIASEEDSCKENVSKDMLRQEEKKNAVKTRQVCDDQPRVTDEKRLLGEGQQTHIHRTQRQAARMARVRRFFAQRDGGAEELQWDQQPPEAEKPVQDNPGETTQSEATLVVARDASQAQDTHSREPDTSESFSVATGGEGDADITDNPSRPHGYAPEECQKNSAAIPADSSSSASSSESGSRFGTVVAPLYQQVFCTVGSERPFVCDRGNPVQTTSTDFSQSFPLTDGKEPARADPTDARSNKDKVAVIKTQELKQDCSHKTLKSSTNEEQEKGFLVENVEEENVQNAESLTLPEILSDQSSNKSDVFNTVLGDKVVHPQSPDSLNSDLSTPILFAERLNFLGEAQEDDVSNDVQGQRTVGTALDPLPEHPCAQMETSTEMGISLEILEKALECFESNGGADGWKSQTFHGKAQEANIGKMLRCRPGHGDTVVKQNKGSTTCEETDANGHFEHDGIRQTQNTDVHYSKMMVEKEENIVSTDEEQELSFTMKDTEVSEEDGGEQTDNTESETTDSTFIATITAAGEKDKDTQDTFQGIQETGGNQIGEKWAEKARNGAKVGSLKSSSMSQEEKRTAEPAIKREYEQEEMESEKETFQVNIERQDVLEQEAAIEEEFVLQSNNGDDHKAQERHENVEDKNPDDREDILVNLASEVESVAIHEQENEVRCSDARLNLTDNMAEDGFSAPVSDVQHKQESAKENTGEGKSANTANVFLHKEEASHNNTIVTHDISKAQADEPQHAALALEWPCALADEPESDRLSLDNTSSESDSDDEVELYMHCLRAVHGGTQAQKDKHRDAGSNTAKSVSRGKLLSTPMPSISESVDEEQLQCWHQDSNEEMAEIHTKAAALPITREQRDVSINVSRWDSLNCDNVSKTLLYATMLVSFVFVAFYYDFLVCFGLYIVSIIWLCWQSERQQVKNNRLG